MITNSIPKRFYAFITALIIIFIDQLSKFWVNNTFLLGQNNIIIHNTLSITKLYNTGAAFSLLQDHTNILTLFSFIFSSILIFYFIKNKNINNTLFIYAWGFILGGSIGNLIDRLFLGYVIDFINVQFINFPVFNIADASINIGAFLLLIYVIKKLKINEEYA